MWAATNVELRHFLRRYRVVVPVWIPPAERFLVEHYLPVWKSVLDSFRNHHWGRERTGRGASWQDTMRFGRGWARQLRHIKTQDQARGRVVEFLGDK